MSRVVPASLMTASRTELTQESFTCLEGVVPAELGGHYFFAGPVGNVGTSGLPRSPTTYPLNGDGMVYRCDFSAGQVSITSRLMKTPDYLADEYTLPGGAFGFDPLLRFSNSGMIRSSPRLGIRNFLNTALVPMRFPGDTSTRLMVTYDGGRHYELDPVSLQLVTPVGRNDEWHAEALGGRAFAPVLSTAHPSCDFRTGELFSVNYGRSTQNILEDTAVVQKLLELPDELLESMHWVLVQLGLADALGRPRSARVRSTLNALFKKGRDFWLKSKSQVDVIPFNFTYLLRWNGQGDLERWQLIDPQGVPVTIRQTAHQLGVSKDFVLLADTSFKFTLDQALQNPLSGNPAIEQVLRWLVTYPQDPFTRIYIVPRAQLVPGNKLVTCQVARVPLELVHFITEYQNPGGRITFHAQHNAALDLAEWLRPYDINLFDGKSASPRAEGYLAAGGMDIGRVGRYTVDGQTGIIRQSVVITEDPLFFNPALYTGWQSPGWSAIPDSVPQLWWMTLGVFDDLYSFFVKELYEHYPHRQVTLQRLVALNQEQIPAAIFRQDTQSMRIEAVHRFLPDQVPVSIQFVPRMVGGVPDPDPLAGYLATMVCNGDQNELWIFRAKECTRVCRLYTPALKSGATIHAAWMPEIAPRTAPYTIPFSQDYAFMAQGSRAEQQLYALLTQTLG